MILLFWKQRTRIIRQPTGGGVLTLANAGALSVDLKCFPDTPQVVETDLVHLSLSAPTMMLVDDHLNSPDQVGMLKDQTRLMEN